MSSKTLSSLFHGNKFLPPYSTPSFNHKRSTYTYPPNKFVPYYNPQIGNKILCLSKSNSDTRKEDIVIVGAGIAGLATALALHRFYNKPSVFLSLDLVVVLLVQITLSTWRLIILLGILWFDLISMIIRIWFCFRVGIPSLVLEQSETLRKGGTSLTLFKNGWKVLDILGVGNELRTQFLQIQG